MVERSYIYACIVPVYVFDILMINLEIISHKVGVMRRNVYQKKKNSTHHLPHHPPLSIYIPQKPHLKKQLLRKKKY